MKNFRKYMKRNWPLYTMVIPGVVLIFIFSYIPMYGVIMAFQRFKPGLGFFGSPIADPPWRYFQQLFNDPYFWRIFKNTLVIGLSTFLLTFPAPIILALLFNELKGKRFKKVTQTISYMPYFLSTVVVVGLIKMLFATDGPVAQVATMLGSTITNPLLSKTGFIPTYLLSSLWSGVGYASIIYLAAISNIDQEMYEAARLDGANRFQQVIHVTVPAILPTIVIQMIFAVSGVVNADTGKLLLMYNPAVYEVADTIGTYVYRQGIAGTQQSYAAAAGLFTNVLSFVMLVLANQVARKVNETSLW